jgi:hypothetical protein
VPACSMEVQEPQGFTCSLPATFRASKRQRKLPFCSWRAAWTERLKLSYLAGEPFFYPSLRSAPLPKIEPQDAASRDYSPWVDPLATSGPRPSESL